MKAALPWIAVIAAVFLLLTNEVPPEPGSDEPVVAFATKPPGGLQEVDPGEIGRDCTDAPRCDGDYLALLEEMTADGRTGADWLMEDLESRDLLYAELSNVPAGPIQQISLVFEDPLVGVFEALLHMPGGEPPWAPAIAVPGRNQTTTEWPEDRVDQAKAGTMLLVLQPRAADGAATEARLGVQLATVGLTLEDLRAYEVALVKRYLLSRPDTTRGEVPVIENR